MSWYSKEHPTPLDTLQLEGLNFWIGDQAARRYKCAWYEGHKKPMMTLPSSTLSLEYSQEHELGVVLGGVAVAPVFASADEALEAMKGFNSAFHCEVFKVLNDDHHIQVHAYQEARIFYVTYDNPARQLADVMVERA